MNGTRPPQHPASPRLHAALPFAGATAARAGSWLQVAHFAAIALVAALTPSAWDRPMRRATARQIYFSAWQALPGFALAGAALCYVLMRIVIGTANEYGVSQYAAELSVRLLALELLPLLAALLVALRSGAAVCARIALMHAAGEFDAMRRAGGDPLRHVLVPRAIGSVVAVTLLSVFGCVLALALAYEATYGLSPWALPQYLRITGQVFGPVVVTGLALKVLLFGLAVAAVPVVAARTIPPERERVPIAVMRAMVRLALALVAIEIGLLAVLYG